jgi:hypothetical protein
MELVKIENLLEKYFDGETTIQEEDILQTYFSQAYVPSHLEEYQSMFSYFKQTKAETSDQNIQVKREKKPWKMYGTSVVAAILLLFLTLYFFIPKNDGLSKEDRILAENALLETQKAFALISENLNKGNQAIAVLETYDDAQSKIFITNK